MFSCLFSSACPLSRILARSLFFGAQVEFTNVLIDGCLFEKCYASKKGGGLHQGIGQMTVVDSLFYNNTAGSGNSEAGESRGF